MIHNENMRDHCGTECRCQCKWQSWEQVTFIRSSTLEWLTWRWSTILYCSITNLISKAQQETGLLQVKMKDISLLFDWCSYSPRRISLYFTFNNCSWHNTLYLRWLLWLRNSPKMMLLFSAKPTEASQGQGCKSIYPHSSDKYQLYVCSLSFRMQSWWGWISAGFEIFLVCLARAKQKGFF